MTTSWTNVPKPLGTSSVISKIFTGGEPIGLLIALTASQIQNSSVVTGIWTDVTKPIGTVYTNVPKAT